MNRRTLLIGVAALPVVGREGWSSCVSPLAEAVEEESPFPRVTTVEARLLTPEERDRWWAFLNQNGLYRKILWMHVFSDSPTQHEILCTSLDYVDKEGQHGVYTTPTGKLATVQWWADLQGVLPT